VVNNVNTLYGNQHQHKHINVRVSQATKFMPVLPELQGCYLTSVKSVRSDRLRDKVPLEQAAVKHVRQCDC
jgi:hypothetical protein